MTFKVINNSTASVKMTPKEYSYKEILEHDAIFKCVESHVFLLVKNGTVYWLSGLTSFEVAQRWESYRFVRTNLRATLTIEGTIE